MMIATPLHQHFPVIRDALLAGKHVFCEKALVFKPEEVRAMRKLAAGARKQVIQVGSAAPLQPVLQDREADGG